MTTEWKELKTLQEVAAAQAAGEEIQVNYYDSVGWHVWDGFCWKDQWKYRSRPKPRTKKIVLREALRATENFYWTAWYSEGTDFERGFVRWLDTPAREIEVPE